MTVITVFSGSHCGGEDVSRDLAEALGYQLISEGDVLDRLVDTYGLAPARARKILNDKPSIFNRFTRERERVVAMYKAAVAELLTHDSLVFRGRAGHLIPPSITHVLKVCLIADQAYRVARAKERLEQPAARIVRAIKADDESLKEWTEFLRHKEPFNPSSFDIVIPVNLRSLDEAIELILENVRKPIVHANEQSIQAVRDFALATKVEVALCEEGHDVDIVANGGRVTLTIDRHVIMLSRLESELERVTRRVEGVGEVEVRVGPNFYQPDIYRKHDFEVPTKVLLVDDEQEFAQTLSERLLMREMGSAVAFNGEEALSVIAEDEPEVMVLDLKMPGIDGIEVLRRVKRDHPEVEVIILTGHGSEEDEKVCRALGAFEYLRKPVDIDELSDAMKAAYQRIRERRSVKKEG